MVDVGRSGQVTFTFRCTTPRQVYLVGDFNQWRTTATPMTRGSDGAWSVSLWLPPGQHHFRYFEEGGAWHTDFAAAGLVRNEFGSLNSVVEVEAPSRLRAVPDSYLFSQPRRYN